MTSFVAIPFHFEPVIFVHLADLEVPVDPVFCKDFSRLGPERDLSVHGVSLRGLKLEEAVEKIFREVVEENPDLLLQTTKEACQTGTANLLIDLTQQTERIQPLFQNIRTAIDISKLGADICVSISLTATATRNRELEAYVKPYCFKGRLIYHIFADKAVPLKPCVEID